MARRTSSKNVEGGLSSSGLLQVDPRQVKEPVVPRRGLARVGSMSLTLPNNTPPGTIPNTPMASNGFRGRNGRRATIDMGSQAVLDLRMLASQEAAPQVAEPGSLSANLRAPTLARKHHLPSYDVTKIIRSFDQIRDDRPGMLSKPDFRKVMCLVFDVETVDDQIVDSAYKATDCQKDVDIDAFLGWYVQNMFTTVSKLSGSADKKQSDDLVTKLANENSTSVVAIDKVKTVFDKFDEDKSGLLDFTEYQNMMVVLLKAPGISYISEERLKKFWHEIDRNGDGTIDFAEFTKWYLKYFNPNGDDPDGFSLGPVEALYSSYDPSAQRWQALLRNQEHERRTRSK